MCIWLQKERHYLRINALVMYALEVAGLHTEDIIHNVLSVVVTDSKSVLMHYVEENPCNIISYRFTVSRTENVLRYKIKVGDREKNVPEDSLFATLEEAEARCKELTLEKIRREERY